MTRLTAVLLATIVAASCTDETTGPGTGVAEGRHEAPMQITAMTWNVYIGADIDRILSVAPEQIPFEVAALWAEVQGSDFPGRARAIARQVAESRPHLIGLQEVTVFRIQSPGDFTASPAQIVVLDFLDLLLDALAARGLDYYLASAVENHSIELPMFNGSGLDDIRFTDYDVVLARGDVSTSNPQAHAFTLNLQVPLPTGPLEIRRGWTSVEAEIGPHRVHFVSTHLEPPEYAPQIQELQAAQLIAALAASPIPVIITGDLNSAADGTSTASYAAFRAAGYVDVWDTKRDGAGLTCCHAKDLRNSSWQGEKRIDYMLARGWGADGSGTRGANRAWLVGEALADRTPSGLWPSDHVGVVASIQPPPGQGR